MKGLIKLFFLLIVVFFFTYSCKKNTDSNQLEDLYDSTPYHLEFGNLPNPNIPLDNPLTVQGVKLGRMLFYETKLSRTGTMSCASCHVQSTGFSDTNRFSIGVRGLPGGRQAMAVVNMLWNNNEFFWDGRAHLLRDQSLKPIEDHLEMDISLQAVVGRLKLDKEYVNQFEKAFGSKEITSHKMSLAMEQFMNTIISYNSKYDKVERGEATYTASEQRGRDLFFTEYNAFFPNQSGADCAHCHSGTNFENDEYMNNGLDSDQNFADMGREKVTNNPSDRAKFKVPTLRNIELTPPYMHDGRFQTLEEVVNHYNERLVHSSTIDPALENTRATGLFLDAQDKADLVAFLKTLSDYELVNDQRFSSPFE